MSVLMFWPKDIQLFRHRSSKGSLSSPALHLHLREMSVGFNLWWLYLGTVSGLILLPRFLICKIVPLLVLNLHIDCKYLIYICKTYLDGILIAVAFYLFHVGKSFCLLYRVFPSRDLVYFSLYWDPTLWFCSSIL